MPLPLLLLLALCPDVATTPEDSAMVAFLPSAVNQWQPAEPYRKYAGREIFDYMDGAGEIYLAYGFRELLVQRYARPGQEEVLVEIFDMGSDRSAFGVNTYMKGRGPEATVGQEGEYKSGLLTFWRSRYFVCVRVENEQGEAKAGVLETGRAISTAIGSDGTRPQILQYLPRGEYVPTTVRYLYRHEILNAHFYLSDANILDLDMQTEAVMARMKGDRSVLLIVRYPGSGEAAEAFGKFCAAYMPDTKDEGIIRAENGKWTLCRRKADFLVLMFDARTKSGGQDVVKNVLRRLP